MATVHVNDEVVTNTSDASGLASKRVTRPNKQKHSEQVEAIEAEIQELYLRLNESTSQMKKISSESKEQQLSIGVTAGDIQQLRDSRKGLHDQRRAMADAHKSLSSELRKLSDNEREFRGTSKETRYTDVNAIDEEIAKLQQEHETSSSSSRADEKKMIQRIASLQHMRRDIGSHQEVRELITTHRQQADQLGNQLSQLNSRIEALEIDIATKSKAFNQPNETRGTQIKSIKTNSDATFARIRDLKAEKNKLWEDFKRQSNEYQAFYEAEQIKREEDHRKQDEEAAQAEETKMHAAAEKLKTMDLLLPGKLLCDELERYVRSRVPKGMQISFDSPSLVDIGHGLSVRQVEEDDVVVIVSSAAAGVSHHHGGKAKKAKPFTHSLDVLQQFSEVGVNPPFSVQDVKTVVDMLRQRKVYLESQPCGVRLEEAMANMRRMNGGSRSSNSKRNTSSTSSNKAPEPAITSLPSDATLDSLDDDLSLVSSSPTGIGSALLGDFSGMGNVITEPLLLPTPPAVTTTTGSRKPDTSDFPSLPSFSIMPIQPPVAASLLNEKTRVGMSKPKPQQQETGRTGGRGRGRGRRFQPLTRDTAVAFDVSNRAVAGLAGVGLAGDDKTTTITTTTRTTEEEHKKPFEKISKRVLASNNATDNDSNEADALRQKGSRATNRSEGKTKA